MLVKKCYIRKVGGGKWTESPQPENSFGGSFGGIWSFGGDFLITIFARKSSGYSSIIIIITSKLLDNCKS
jgi:hypothetical protein